uniref:Uncharacterized protein n=1 Tax=Kalanchoe fedtschenkoi TaxID=63787 RepID=A0A7N0U4M9_KALFE
MASTTSSSSLPLPSSSSTLVDGKTLRPSAVGVTFPPPPLHSRTSSSSSWKPSTYCRKIVRNVAASMATGEAPADVAGFETPEIVKTVQEYVCFTFQLQTHSFNIHCPSFGFHYYRLLQMHDVFF